MKDTILKYQFLFFTLGVLFLSTPVPAQDFFKVLNSSSHYSDQKIGHFQNGDLLVGKSSIEALSTGNENGEIVLYRLDKCGNEIWAKHYEYENGYLELKDLTINENDEIFIYGSHYQGLAEFIFIAKLDGLTGINIGFRLFNPGTVDHFSYSIDARNGQLMIYGLLFDFNTLKLGFIGLFDESLNFQWAKKFTPFQSNGNAIITYNGFLGWSGEYLIKLDSDGTLQWAKTLNQTEGLRITNGPLEIAGGYLFEIHREGQSMLIKVNQTGQVLWQSDLFISSSGSAAISILPNGNFICTYTAPKDDGTEICQLFLTTDGEIEDQKRLLLEEHLNTGTIYQNLDDQRITIAGNSNPVALNQVDIQDFIFQFELNNAMANCFSWESFDATFPNNYILEFTDHPVIPESFEMIEEARINLDALNFELSVEELCNPLSGPGFIQKDTLLDCGQSWVIELPDADFTWLDNNSNELRVLDQPGTFQARKQDCSDPIVIDYTLDILDCPCEITMPNIFSPNQDGFNDQLELFSDCQMDNIEISVFNRWGAKVYQANNLNQFWDGTFKGEAAPNGVYIFLVEYGWTDASGPRRKMVSQDVTLIR